MCRLFWLISIFLINIISIIIIIIVIIIVIINLYFNIIIEIITGRAVSAVDIVMV